MLSRSLRPAPFLMSRLREPAFASCLWGSALWTPSCEVTEAVEALWLRRMTWAARELRHLCRCARATTAKELDATATAWERACCACRGTSTGGGPG